MVLYTKERYSLINLKSSLNTLHWVNKSSTTTLRIAAFYHKFVYSAQQSTLTFDCQALGYLRYSWSTLHVISVNPIVEDIRAKIQNTRCQVDFVFITWENPGAEMVWDKKLLNIFSWMEQQCFLFILSEIKFATQYILRLQN